jgi:hypothetical protein
MTGIPSHSRECLLQLAKRGGRGRQRSETVTPRQVQVRLSPDDIGRLVAAYQSGRRTTELAMEFGVHRNTVQRWLTARGLLLSRGPHEPDPSRYSISRSAHLARAVTWDRHRPRFVTLRVRYPLDSTPLPANVCTGAAPDGHGRAEVALDIDDQVNRAASAWICQSVARQANLGSDDLCDRQLRGWNGFACRWSVP